MNESGRRARLEALFAQHAGAVHAYALRRIDPQTAQDIVGEVFVVAWRRIEDVPIDALPWLLACVWRVLANQRWVRSGALRAAGSTLLDGRRLDVLVGRRTTPPVTQGRPQDFAPRVFVDPRTSTPVQVSARTRASARSTMVITTTVTGYARLPFRAQDEKLLALSAHPSARTECRVFAPDGSAGNCAHDR